MVFQEKSLQCADCGASFPFTVQEQEFFASKGYTNEPKRCPACRQSRKASSGTYERRTYPAVCAECGRDTEVPFQPREERPVYCRECYLKVRMIS